MRDALPRVIFSGLAKLGQFPVSRMVCPLPTPRSSVWEQRGIEPLVSHQGCSFFDP